MTDWRLENKPNYLYRETLQKIVFPDFWDNSFANKNDFYNEIKQDAENFVKTYKRGAEYLKGKKIQDFWHAHCVFCTDKITTRDSRICYCTDNFSTWVCQNCFDDFNKQFCWNIKT